MRSKLLTYALVAIALACCVPLTYASRAASHSIKECSPSRITLGEARTLLQATSDLSAVKRRGGRPILILFNPAGPYSRPGDFYYFVVYERGPAGRTSADGGLVGYFAVQKDTAKVFDTVLMKSLDDEAALRSLELKLRRKHCVTAKTMSKWRNVWP
jgi:hypothetical protein